ncbi:MAG: hypothetical protein ACRBCS_02920 [Cellvibrionaceae bacterium]
MTEEIDLLAKKIAENLQVPFEDKLWSAEDCAKYFHVSEKHFKDRVSKKSSFPLPVEGKKMWFACEVVGYAKTNRAA